MEENKTFESIAESTADILDNAPVEQQEAPAEEIPAEPTAAQQEAATEEAVNTAVEATQMAVQKQQEVNDLVSQLEAEKAKTQQLEALVAQQNAQNEQKVVEELAKEAPIAPPVLDIDTYDDAETIKSKTQKYNEDYDVYIRAKMNGEFAPMLEFSKQAMAEREHSDAVKTVRNISEIANMGDYDDYSERVESMIANNKSLKSEAPLAERMMNAYLIAKGYEAITAEHKEPTVQEVFDKYKENPEFMELFNKSMIEKAKEAKDVPSFASSGGVSNAAPNVKERPKSFEEVYERTKSKFN